MLKLIFILTVVYYSYGTENNPTVTAPLGKYKGTLLESRLGKTIYSFRGIRYAQPPVGDLRFKPPTPIEKHNGTFDATQDGPTCPQPNLGSPQSEDCLLLNVYSTKLPTGQNSPKRPVIVHFHAGGYYSVTGRSNWAGPQYYLDQKIVLVTLNYRLGSLGFMSTGDKVVIGNNGLKDQVMALKWVQKNIAAFGGDPNSVTIMGYSAGAWSVSMHMVSPMSRGLFHKAVSSSGSILGIWPIPKSQPEIAKKQARLLNCPDDTSENIVNCLKNKTAEEIGATLFGFFEFGGFNPILLWSPVIEEDYGQERFLPDHPINLIKQGKLADVPFMSGVTKDEFGYEAFGIFDNETLLNQLDKDWNKKAPICFIYERDTPKSLTVSKTIRKAYIGDGPLTNDSFGGVAKLYEDGVIGYAANRIIKLYSQNKKSESYYYKFSYQGRYSHYYLTNTTTPYGVVHHDDLIYQYYISPIFPFFNQTDPESKMVEKLTTLYYNFAKFGNPTPKIDSKLDNAQWIPFNLKTQNYLDIDEKLCNKQRLYDNRYKVWESLYPIDKI